MQGKVSIQRVISQIRELDCQERDARTSLDSPATGPHLYRQLTGLLNRIKIQRQRLTRVVLEAKQRGERSVQWRDLVPNWEER